MRMIQSQRLQVITDHLRIDGSLSISDLVSILKVSRETIRRDLLSLQEQGLVERVRGGIMLRQNAVEPAYQARSVSHCMEKRSIAEAALQLISDGDTVYIDSGTTLLELARLLHRKVGLTVFTNSILVAFELAQQNMHVYMTGGELRTGEMSLSGPIAGESIDKVFFDLAFVGAGGISADHGITDFHMEEAVLRRAVLQHAAKKVVLADSSKYNVTAFAKVVPVKNIDVLITDNHFPAQGIPSFAENGVEVIRGD
jgi:DeoR/GlpR family transcriptional regulator of sugar metabolism